MANAINNRGEVAGVTEDNTPDPNCVLPLVLHFEPVIWRNGQAEQLPTIQGDPDGFANTVNDTGQAGRIYRALFPSSRRALAKELGIGEGTARQWRPPKTFADGDRKPFTCNAG